MGWGYTCFVSSFAIFVSEREIHCSTSPVLKAFSNINTIEAFQKVNLPVLKENECVDKDPNDQSIVVALNKGFEIDLRQQKMVMKALQVPRLDCYPVLWVLSNQSKTEWKINFKQRIACKYLVIKLIDSHKGNIKDNNIDMYNLTLNGY